MTGIEHQIDFITLLLKVLAVLLGVIATGFGWWATGLSKDVKALIIQGSVRKVSHILKMEVAPQIG